MKLIAIAIAATLLAGAASAGPIEDAAAGHAALANGDAAAAIPLFSSAIQSGALPPALEARTLVGRAQAYLATDSAPLAVKDADAALALEPRNLMAEDVRARAQASIAGRGAKDSAPTTAVANDLNAQVKARNDTIAARNAAAASDYQARQADYEARKQADAAAYAQAQADYQAHLRALQNQHDAEMAAWRARVQACRAGDRSQCANDGR